jgi:acyl-CoA synthetase (AMP-forming)/AMP-acid ligase II
MAHWRTLADRDAIENETSWEERDVPKTIYQALSETAAKHGTRNAISFQLLSDPGAKAETLTWQEMLDKTTQAANLFRELGIGEQDVVAYILPNSNETAITLMAGMVAGIANPVNPLLDAEQIASILRETNAKVVVTLKSFPKTDVAQKVAAALEMTPNVTTVLEVDLLRYLTPPKSWIVPFIRPKNPTGHAVKTLNFNAEVARQPKTLQFADSKGNRVGAYFHTGGTTGMPKVAQHTYSGMLYNGWLGSTILFKETDNIMCPLPLFHVFATHVIWMAMVASGAHMVMPTPAGYRGEGVFDNFWKLIERWKITFIIGVPTAIAALMQRPVDADISSVKTAFSGSAPLPVELFNRFKATSGVNIVEGYGLTEATCLVSCNPIEGEQKIGSVGIPFPYTDVRILDCAADGTIKKELGVDEVGEICVSNPGVYAGHTYTDETKNQGLFADGKYLRTGDLGRIDADGFLWITGRAKDLIIRGGHNIDPAEIEDALAGHPAVAMAGAIGQPDAFAGELPCVYVELIAGADASEAELLEFAKQHIHERAAVPKYLEILPELPKTAVGKVFKPDLRKMAIKRIYDEALEAAGIEARVTKVVDDKKKGLQAVLTRTGDVDDAAVEAALGDFTRPWVWDSQLETPG